MCPRGKARKAGERLENRKQTACTFGGLLDSILKSFVEKENFPNSNQGVENRVERGKSRAVWGYSTTSTEEGMKELSGIYDASWKK